MDNILSIGHAHRMSRLFADNNDFGALKELGHVVLSDESLSGDADDFHNLAVTFTRLDDYSTGFEIVCRGLRLYPYNIDLLADAVYYGSGCGRYDESEKYIEVLLSRPYYDWNWRAFSFVSDYYMNSASWLKDPELVVEGYRKALDLAKHQQVILPTEERGYVREFRIHKMLSSICAANGESDNAAEELEKAENALKSAIYNGNIVAVTCCQYLAEHYFESQRYDEVIELCEKAFTFGEEQASVNLAFLLYLSGQSKDVLIHRDNAFDDSERVMDAYSDYTAAILCGDIEGYIRTIRRRCIVLQSKSGIPAPQSIMN